MSAGYNYKGIGAFTVGRRDALATGTSDSNNNNNNNNNKNNNNNNNNHTNNNNNSVDLVRKRTLPTERQQLVGEVSANVCGKRVKRGQRDESIRP
jgi:hypothetical protein